MIDCIISGSRTAPGDELTEPGSGGAPQHDGQVPNPNHRHLSHVCQPSPGQDHRVPRTEGNG